MDPNRLDIAFVANATLECWCGHMRFETVLLGQLVLPTGQIMVCDALALPHEQPLARAVMPGRYSAHISIGHLRGGDQRIAAAKLSFHEAHVARWSPARWLGIHPYEVEPGLPGYPVDSGTGSFFDAAALSFMRRLDFDDVHAQTESTYVHTRQWALIELDAATGLNAAFFSSGFGDGVYAAWWGESELGEPVCLVTDLGLLDPP